VRHNRCVSTLLAICLVAFVILGVVAAIGGNGGQYERIGRSWFEPQATERERDSAAQDRDELL
jgi:hypothetical protein